jgi:hypothetical protein
MVILTWNRTGDSLISSFLFFSFLSFLALSGDGKRAHITGYDATSGWTWIFSLGHLFFFLRFWIGYGLDSEWPAKDGFRDGPGLLVLTTGLVFQALNGKP